jgi:MFS family permease
VGKALVADKAPPQLRGTAIGLFQMSLGFAALVSSLLAGLLWDRLGPAATFVLGAAIALAACLAALTLAPWRTGSAPRT